MDNLLAQYYDYDYSTEVTETASSADPATTAAIYGGMFLVVLIVLALTYVVYSFLLSRIFQKAGVEAWKAWVPVYNSWILLEIGGQQGFWAILAFIPVINIAAAVFMFIAMYQIGLKLGKPGSFVLLAIFLPMVWMIWLAFDSSKWPGKKTTAKKVTAEPAETK